jgi:uncharacterized protein YkwD
MKKIAKNLICLLLACTVLSTNLTAFGYMLDEYDLEEYKNSFAKDLITLGIDVQYNQTEARKALEYVNKLRVENGLNELVYDYKLEEYSMYRAAQTVLYSTSNHGTPNGAGYRNTFAVMYEEMPEPFTENQGLSGSRETAEDYYNLFYNSSGHKAQMLKSGVTNFSMSIIVSNETGESYCIMSLSSDWSQANTTEPTEAFNGVKRMNIEMSQKLIPYLSATNCEAYCSSVSHVYHAPVPDVELTILDSYQLKDLYLIGDFCVEDRAIHNIPVYLTENEELGFTWKIEDENIAEIDDGVIIPKKVGTTKISITFPYEFDASKFDTVTEEMKTNTISIPLTVSCPHDYELINSTEPTCSTTGTKTYQCSLCDEIKTEDVDKLEHTIVIDDAVSATCATSGLTQGSHCSVCNTVIEEQTVIPATGKHTYQLFTTQPNCTQDGYVERKCTTCGCVQYTTQLSALNHNYTATKTVEPTCVEQGYTLYECSRCDDYYYEYSQPTGVHKYITETTPATCTIDGNTKYTCSVCGYTYNEVINRTGHTVVIDKAVEASCTKEGLTQGEHCSVCNTVITQQQVVPMTAHEYVSTVTEPTCKDKGYTTYTCKYCGDTYTDSITDIDESKHIYTSEVTKPATCEETGVKTYTCKYCGKTYDEIIPIVNHIANSPVKENVVEATCSTKGHYDSVIYCVNCETEISRETIETPLLAHKEKSKVTKATTKANGKITYTCSVCGETTKKATTIYYPKTITLSATSYTYDGKVKKPTVTVKDSKGNKIATSNYTVTYASGCKNVGSYNVTIKFKGNYSGTVTKTFKINPKGTTISKLTATSKGFKATWKKQGTQTTGYQIRYSTKSNMSGAKTVTVSKNATTSKNISKLSAKKKYYVQIRTYKTVNGTKYYSSWSSSKIVTTKK